MVRFIPFTLTVQQTLLLTLKLDSKQHHWAMVAATKTHRSRKQNEHKMYYH